MPDVVERTELLVPGPAEGLAALLGVAVPDPAALPPLWHWVYLLDRVPQADLGPDGHPLRGTVPAPPAPGMRRMWAGGRVHYRGPLRIGAEATRRTRVLATQDKAGRSGPLTFVTVEHLIHQAGRVVVEERQDLVYRPASADLATGGDGGDLPPADNEWALDTTPALLFRYSALTYNAHRIHYDRDYARDGEGYPGLVVHGPLQALAMAEAARARRPEPAPAAFEYRMLAPLFDFQGLIARAEPSERGFETSVRDRTGRRTARGTLTYDSAPWTSSPTT